MSRQKRGDDWASQGWVNMLADKSKSSPVKQACRNHPPLGTVERTDRGDYVHRNVLFQLGPNHEHEGEYAYPIGKTPETFTVQIVGEAEMYLLELVDCEDGTDRCYAQKKDMILLERVTQPSAPPAGAAPIPVPDIESDKKLDYSQWSVLVSFCLCGSNSVSEICAMLFKPNRDQGIVDAIAYLEKNGYLAVPKGRTGVWMLTDAGVASRKRWYNKYRFDKAWGCGMGWGRKPR